MIFELAALALLAFVVLGPKRFAHFMGKAGGYKRKLDSAVADFKQQFTDEQDGTLAVRQMLRVEEPKVQDVAPPQA